VLVAPTNGATIKGSTVVVKVRLNGSLTDVGAAFRAQDNSGNQYTPSVSPQVTYRGIPPGRHSIRIELVHDSHDPSSAISSARADFTVIG
jgi:hypothetical protein